jgi:hypothetical protein
VNILYSFYNYFLQSKLIIQFFILLIGSYLTTIISVPFVALFNGSLQSSLQTEEMSLKSIIFFVIVVPILETWLNQYLVFNTLVKYNYFSGRKYMIIFISGAIFGLLHYYSLSYIIWAFFFGSYLCFCYWIFKVISNKAFLLTCLIHIIRNLTALLLEKMT